MNIIDNRYKIKEKANSFISNIRNGVFLYGINKYSIALKNFLVRRNIIINGFVDDFSDLKEYVDTPIVKIRNLTKSDFVINCIVDGRPIEALNKIKEQGIVNYSDYFSLQNLFNEHLPQIDFLEDTDSVYNNEDYKFLFDCLADNESKRTLEKVVNFRFNRDIEIMHSFLFRIDEQYFEDFLGLPDNPVFLDGGGFDGETTKKFSELYPNYQTVHYFEPTKTMLEKSKKILSGLRNINFYQQGLWKETTKLNFDNSQGPTSKISDKVDTKIDVTSIDDVIKENVDFVKLDIEGAEYQALIGAQNLIKNYKPKLAVCVYHSQIDFTRIPELLLSYNPAYKIYLRHYTQGILETVMFFV